MAFLFIPLQLSAVHADSPPDACVCACLCVCVHIVCVRMHTQGEVRIHLCASCSLSHGFSTTTLLNFEIWRFAARV